jgi:hypothetical protein
MKDRAQKQTALRLCVANRWFPQIEVDVGAGSSVQQTEVLVTDLDVFGSIPDEFKGFRTVIFDCKTGAKESPVSRAFWLKGVMERMQADQGFCVLKKTNIELDHRLMANRLGVILLAEDEFNLYAAATCPTYAMPLGYCAEMDLWDKLFEVPKQFSKFKASIVFLRSGYWMVDDPAEACRKIVWALRSLHPEMDPKRPEHLAIFFEFCALFSRSLAILVCRVFRAYLHPAKQGDLADALLILLYGGRDAYEYRNHIFKKYGVQKGAVADGSELSLPEWDRFLNLTRQLLDAPTAAQRVPLILREVAFATLASDSKLEFARILCSESAQGARFSLFVPDYLSRAAKLPSDFAKFADSALLPLQPTKR